MNIPEAIATAQERIAQQKIKLQQEREHWNEIKHLQVNKEVAVKTQKNELLQKLREKGRATDQELLEGIHFIESSGHHFTLHSGRKIALYLCSDRSFQVQQWGMYMGDKYIKPLERDHFDVETLQKVLDADFKELAVKQIVEKPNSKKWEPDEAFKEVFG